MIQDMAKIQIIDDQEPIRRVLNDYVVMLGHSPILAEDGVMALSQIGRAHV